MYIVTEEVFEPGFVLNRKNQKVAKWPAPLYKEGHFVYEVEPLEKVEVDSVEEDVYGRSKKKIAPICECKKMKIIKKVEELHTVGIFLDNFGPLQAHLVNDRAVYLRNCQNTVIFDSEVYIVGNAHDVMLNDCQLHIPVLDKLKQRIEANYGSKLFIYGDSVEGYGHFHLYHTDVVRPVPLITLYGSTCTIQNTKDIAFAVGSSRLKCLSPSDFKYIVTLDEWNTIYIDEESKKNKIKNNEDIFVVTYPPPIPVMHNIPVGGKDPEACSPTKLKPTGAKIYTVPEYTIIEKVEQSALYICLYFDTLGWNSKSYKAGVNLEIDGKYLITREAAKKL